MVNNNYQKRSPNVLKDNKIKENTPQLGFGLGISGESMHLEEKSFMKRIMADGTLNIINGISTKRNAGSSKKR